VGPRNGPDLRPLSELRTEILASRRVHKGVVSEVGRSAEILCPKCNVEGRTLAFRDAAKKYKALRLRQQILGVTSIQSENIVNVAGAAGPQMRVKDRIFASSESLQVRFQFFANGFTYNRRLWGKLSWPCFVLCLCSLPSHPPLIISELQPRTKLHRLPVVDVFARSRIPERPQHSCSMSSSADIQMNGNAHTSHDHILRPRAVKPANQAVLRTLNEEGLLAADNVQNGNISGQTRCDISSLELH
jgi:hypothetical protein